MAAIDRNHKNDYHFSLILSLETYNKTSHQCVVLHFQILFISIWQLMWSSDISELLKKQTRIFLLGIRSKCISYSHLWRARFTFQSCFSKEITATNRLPQWRNLALEKSLTWWLYSSCVRLIRAIHPSISTTWRVNYNNETAVLYFLFSISVNETYISNNVPFGSNWNRIFAYLLGLHGYTGKITRILTLITISKTRSSTLC